MNLQNISKMLYHIALHLSSKANTSSKLSTKTGNKELFCYMKENEH